MKSEPEARGGRRLNAIRVIFVDDEPRVLEGLKRMLRPKRNEWDMTFVGSAQAALDALKQQPREVVVTDMRMPGMSGAELLEVVQREYPDTIRLILSGQAETESVMKALGVSHQFLSKPCDAEILQGTIARAFTLRDLAGNSGRQDAGRAHQQTTDAARHLPEAGRVPEEPERRHGRRREDHLARSVDVRAPAQGGQLRLLRPRQAGRRRGRAGALLGLDRIMALVLGQGIFSGGEMPKVRGFSLEALWAHSLATATAAHRIAIEEGLDKDTGGRGVPRRHAARHRQAGARHGHARTNTRACWSWRRASPASEREFEMLELQASHTDVGAYLVGLWGLPNTIAEAIAFHEDPAQSTVASFGLPGIVHVADRIAHHPDIADPRTPELRLNFEYLEKHQPRRPLE